MYFEASTDPSVGIFCFFCQPERSLCLLRFVLVVHCNAVVETSGQCEPYLVRDQQHPGGGVDLKEGIHCGRRGNVSAQNLSQGLKSKLCFYLMKASLL